MVEIGAQTKHSRILSFHVLVMLVLWIVGCLFLFHQRNHRKMVEIRKKINHAKRHLLRKYNSDEKLKSSYQKKKIALLQPLTALHRLQRVTKNRVYQILLSILTYRPKGIKLTTLKISADRVFLRGVAKTPRQIITFLKQFRNSDVFQAVKLMKMSKSYYGFDGNKPQMQTEFTMKMLPEKLSQLRQIKLPLYFPSKEYDPFQTSGRSVKWHKPPPLTKTSEVLVKVSIEQIKCVATVSEVGNPIAMLQGPKGFGHMVRPGYVLGRNRDRVVRILKDGILLERMEEGRRIPIKLLRERN